MEAWSSANWRCSSSFGLFPFAATVITRGQGSAYALAVYLSLILACQHYILVGHPALRVNGDVSEQMRSLQRGKAMVISTVLVFITLRTCFQSPFKRSPDVHRGAERQSRAETGWRRITVGAGDPDL